MSLLYDVLDIMAFVWPQLERYRERLEVEKALVEMCAPGECRRSQGAAEIHKFARRMEEMRPVVNNDEQASLEKPRSGDLAAEPSTTRCGRSNSAVVDRRITKLDQVIGGLVDYFVKYIVHISK